MMRRKTLKYTCYLENHVSFTQLAFVACQSSVMAFVLDFWNTFGLGSCPFDLRHFLKNSHELTMD